MFFLSILQPADPKKLLPSSPVPMQMETTLSNGTVVTYEQAHRFMEWYCRRYLFPAPEIDCFLGAKIKDAEILQGAKTQGVNKQGYKREWDATMTVGGRRIGIGTGLSEEAALTACYLDVVRYLESCDAELWKTYVES